MIKYFTVENFRSIKNENILDFDSDLPKDYWYVANPIIGFAGANASGKTTVLRALTFALWFMQSSWLQLEAGKEIPIAPFWTTEDLPTKFHLIFAQETNVDGEPKMVNYEYELSLTKEKVLREALYYYPYRRKRVAYLRDGNQVKFGASIRHIDTRDLRENSSIISLAAQFSSQQVAIACKNYSVISNLRHDGLKQAEFRPQKLAELLRDEATRERMRSFLRIADLGIEDIYWKEYKIMPAMMMDDFEKLEKVGSGQPVPQLVRPIIDGVLAGSKKIGRVFFRHRLENMLVDFPPELESAGTLQFLATLERVINALRDGAVLILDEIELKLHQLLVQEVIDLFNSQFENEKGAQLIFSFHNTFVMENLMPAQLWFTQKNDEGYTEIFSAIDFNDIKQLHQKDLETLYRVGRFGAHPRGL